MEEAKVGGWISAYCTTCRDVREHVVVAMVGLAPAKVECTSCHKQHKYRATAPEKGVKASDAPKAPRTVKPRKASPAQPAVDTQDLAARILGRATLRYDPTARFAVEDVVEHPSFGVGVVTSLPGTQKVEILFPSGAKLLQHDRAAQKAGLTRPPPRNEDGGPDVSDAPARPR